MALLYAPDAFDSVPQSERRRLVRKAEWLWNNRKVISHSLLRHDLNPFMRWRVDVYRIIYTYDEETDEMVIHLGAHRDDVYERAAKLNP